jgi:hypothetical protein
MRTKSHRRAWLLLLALPYLAMLWVPSYNAVEPSWMGFPFFYWYQLLWVVLCSALAAVVFKMTRP